MKKYVLLLGCSLVAAGTVVSASADNGLKAVKDLYLKEFQAMDTDKDGKISQQEYLTHQFNSLRADIIDAEGFDVDENTVEIQSSVETKPVSETSATEASERSDNIVGVPAALQDMANYELEDDDLLKEDPVRLTKEDVMPESETEETVDELDLSISEEENLRQLMEGVENPPVVEETDNQETQIQFMLDTIRKTLPKKIDEITTWTDIRYADNVIDYIYKADIDTAIYSADELKVLKDNIQNEACIRAYSDMCPKIKPMFIDKGIDMRIVYFDKSDDQISACEFNKTTCNE